MNAESTYERKNMDALLVNLHNSYTELLNVLVRVEKELGTLTANHSFVAEKLAEHVDAEEQELFEIKNTIKTELARLEGKILSGFPNNDPIRHHDYHVKLDGDAADRKRRTSDVITHAVKNIVWAIIAFAAGAIWFYMKSGPQ